MPTFELISKASLIEKVLLAWGSASYTVRPAIFQSAAPSRSILIVQLYFFVFEEGEKGNQFESRAGFSGADGVIEILPIGAIGLRTEDYAWL